MMKTLEQPAKSAEGKHLPMMPLLDFLAPPVGWHVERALCASYSAQSSVLAAMLMALNGEVTAHGSGSSVTLARALRRLKGKVHFLIQHGRLAAPQKRRAVLGMFDRFIVSVPFEEGGHEGKSWHPKVCLIKYAPDEAPEKGAQSFWKLWVGSRNFTRDGSWDIGFSLSSDPAQRSGQLVPGIDELAARLAVCAGQKAKCAALVSQLRSVRWQVPKGIKSCSVHLLLPDDVREGLPDVPAATRSMLAVAPFIEARELQRLAASTPGAARAVISTEDAIAGEIGDGNGAGDYTFFTLPPTQQDAVVDHQDTMDDDEEPEMGGLHAKLIWFEHALGATMCLGSPNLTLRGWRRNVECYVRLEIARRGSSAAADAIHDGVERFRVNCTRVDPVGLQPAVDKAAEKLLEQERKKLAFLLDASQRLARDDSVTVTSAGHPTLADGVAMFVGRIGDIGVAWPATSIPVALPPAPRWENSDLLHITLRAGGHEVGWLQHAPFVPALSDDERDLPLLQSFLGLKGLLDWLGDVLDGVQGAGTSGHDWNDDEPPARTRAGVSLPFSVEAVMAAWVRKPELLKEARAVMALARNYQASQRDDPALQARLRSFLKVWPILETNLR